MGLEYRIYFTLLDGINWLFDRYTGGKRRPVFFDIEKTYPPLLELDRSYDVIREELLSLLPQKQAIPRYHELDSMQHYISGSVDPDKDWKVFYLYAMGEIPEANRERCPRTSALLEKIPGLFQSFFSILDGGKSVPAHCGPYRGYLRYHLGLVVPEKNPPSIRIKDQHYTWQESQSVLFDDSWEHEVFNKSDSERVVLIVDIRRPMPLPFDSLNRFVEYVMRLVYGRQILKKLA
jgi:aspartyl/asparaginyl beta-hydroxylase (cupin superfamily)